MEPIDLFDPATQQDWYPTYDRMRTECPAYQIPETNTWVLTRYDDVHRALRRPERFPNGAGTKSLIGYAPARKYWDEHGWQKRTPLGTNPPVHRNYRALIDGFFDAAGAERARPAITETVHRLLDQWRSRRHLDYVADFATPLPVEVITRIIGFPATDIPQLRVWSAAWVMPFSLGLTDDEQMYVAEQGVAFQRYIHEIAEQRRSDPADDVISRLVHARYNDVELGVERPLEDWEIINIVDHLYIGGNETTTFALSSGLWLMLREPEVLHRLQAEPDLVPELVEEALRLESPTQGLFKGVAEACPIGALEVPAGATVHLRYAAANRDPEMFPNPDQLDLDRANKRRHVAFAVGEHICPGAELSRLEQVIAHQALIQRVHGLRLAADNDFTHHPGFVLRALNHLNVEFDSVD
jgi:cytochrome P450